MEKTSAAQHLPTFADAYLAGHLGSYVTAHRIASDHVQMLEAAQPAGDCSDAASSDLVLSWPRATLHHRSNFGGGFFEERTRANHIVLTAPNTPTEIFCYQPHVIRTFTMSSKWILEAFEDTGVNSTLDFGRLHHGTFRNALATEIMDRVWDEAERGDAISRLYADGAALHLTSTLLRQAQMPPIVHRGGLAAWQVRRAIEMIQANVGGEMTLPTLAAEVGLSPYHFARAFKTSTGKPPHAYQTGLRIERAKWLLEHSMLSVTEIALEVGYESSQALARLFQRSVGLSPSAYRRGFCGRG